MSAMISALVVAAVSTDYQAYNTNQQQKSVKKAAAEADANQQALIREAKSKAAGEEATNASAVARARQKALAAAVAGSGRSGTIKTGQQGAIGDVPGTQKQLIGE